MPNQTILIDDVQKELNQFLSHNTKLVSGAVYSPEVVLNKHTKPLTKVKGAYPSSHTLLSNVVQGWGTAWNEMGVAQITHKILKSYRQKVNFAIIPAEILNTYYAEMYAEGKDLKDMPISKYIIENELMPKVIDNLQYLSVNGVYDPAKLDEFGFSMNGIIQLLVDMKAEAITGNPCFMIPLSALTDTNIVDQVTSYERQLPSKNKSQIKKVFMSENNAERYVLRYEDLFGQNKFQNNTLKTRLGKREIVALPGADDDFIFCTTDNNFRNLSDMIENPPQITDIQKQDYKLKIFMEWEKGYDFLINQAVMVANYTNARYGLGSTELNQKYYGIDGVTV